MFVKYKDIEFSILEMDIETQIQWEMDEKILKSGIVMMRRSIMMIGID